MTDDVLFAPIQGISTPTLKIAAPVGDIRIPQLWFDVIDKVRAVPSWESATIAGGALRDLDQGRPIKDVDIFVPFSDKTYDRLEQVLESLGIEVDLNLDEIKHNSGRRTPASKVATKHHNLSHFLFAHDGWKFEVTQVVEAFDHYSIIDTFDIGLCMISLAGNAIYRSHHYVQDAAQKRLTIVRDTGGGEMHHAKRIGRKYSGWTIVEFSP